MGALRDLVEAFRAGAARGGRPRNDTPVPYTSPGGRTSWMGGGGSKTTALGVTQWNGTIYGIVDAQATAQSQITWRLYRTAASGRDEDREEVDRHPALSVWQKPNPFYSQKDLVEVLFNHYELTGEMWLLPARSGLAPSGPPIELWAMRPDRMRPLAHPTKFISGYLYTPGTSLMSSVELGVDEVIVDMKRDPKDPYRGLSPIWAALTDLRSEQAAAEYNAAFFANDATPGGLVKIPGYLDDVAWREMQERWNEQHKGVHNAHRIHVLDNVKDAEFESLAYTRKDMQFTELRTFNIQAFMLAYRISDFVLGRLSDVNRATAEASDVFFGKAHVVPRARRLRDLLNLRFLPMYGALGKGYEFDFDDPIPPDRTQALAEQDAAIRNALALIAAGFDETEVFEYFDIPAFARHAMPAPAEPEMEPAEEEPMEDMAEARHRPTARHHGPYRPIEVRM